LEIAILGKPGGVFAKGANDWVMFVEPWSSPIIWLFFGGFVLAAAAAKTRLDFWLARQVLKVFGDRPGAVLCGVMGITFLFSMFMSNTATTAMMMAVMSPLILSLKKENPFTKALLLGIPFAANIGGMGTIIGSPPNAIAVGSLVNQQIDFAKWIVVGMPPALLLAFLSWLYLIKVYPSKEQHIDLVGLQSSNALDQEKIHFWKKLTVFVVFLVTVILWMTSSLHSISTPVVSFIPITIFSVVGIIGVKEIRNLNWDILLLLTGGLSLGVAVAKTGLASWLVSSLPFDELGRLGALFLFSYLAILLSNFMSNTAATNILVPISLALANGLERHMVMVIALGASSAMCLPISTPPNAIAFASGHLKSSDFTRGGLLIGLIAPIIFILWAIYIM